MSKPYQGHRRPKRTAMWLAVFWCCIHWGRHDQQGNQINRGAA